MSDAIPPPARRDLADMAKSISSSKYLTLLTWPTVPPAVPPRGMFVCGYRRTGKDTFVRELLRSGGIRETFEHGWEVYAYGPDSGTAIERLLSFCSAETVAFSDALRMAVYDQLGLPETYDYELNKDVPIPGSPPDHPITLRDCLILVGRMGRELDAAHWVKHALVRFFSGDSEVPRRTVICSDFRFTAEYARAAMAGMGDIFSVRLFRSDVPIPAANIISEHDVDNFATDCLLVRDAAEFEAAKKLFPRYGQLEYVRVGKLGV